MWAGLTCEANLAGGRGVSREVDPGKTHAIDTARTPLCTSDDTEYNRAILHGVSSSTKKKTFCSLHPADLIAGCEPAAVARACPLTRRSAPTAAPALRPLLHRAVPTRQRLLPPSAHPRPLLARSLPTLPPLPAGLPRHQAYRSPLPPLRQLPAACRCRALPPAARRSLPPPLSACRCRRRRLPRKGMGE